MFFTKHFSRAGVRVIKRNTNTNMLIHNQNTRCTTLFRICSTAFSRLLLITFIPFVQANDPKTATVNSGNQVYLAQFFEQYRPQNALQMVERLPGFTFDEGSSDRGFGANAGNVLIDGARPTAKSGGLSAALKRIPADQVEKIEIIRGGVGGGEAAGQTVVANILRKHSGTNKTWTLKYNRSPDGKALPSLAMAFTTKISNWNTAFDFDIGQSPSYRKAIIENRNTNDKLTSSAFEKFPSHSTWAFINGELAQKFDTGILTLNARIGSDKWSGDTTRNIFTNSLPYESSVNSLMKLYDETQDDIVEIGMNWTANLNNWSWRTMGLSLLKDYTYDNKLSVDDFGTDDIFTSEFNQRNLKSELIARTTIRRTGNIDFKPEFGIEVANNKLDSELSFTENNVSLSLIGSDVTVQELRMEAFSSFNWQVAQDLGLEGGLTAEFSKIEVSGNSQKEQSFRYLKPRLSATYSIKQDQRVIVKIDRRVNQLEFDDFAASTQALDGRVTSGNPDLVPDKVTELSATYDYNFSERGSFEISLYHQWRADILEQISLPDGGQGLGNAGKANVWGMKSNLSLPLDMLLTNGLLEVSYSHNDSDFNDPIIQASRRINKEIPEQLTVKLRQDLTKQQFSWGIDFNNSYIERRYLVDELQIYRNNNVFNFFAETTRFFGIKSRIELNNINIAENDRTRLFYNDTRNGSFAGSQVSKRRHKLEIKIILSGTF